MMGILICRQRRRRIGMDENAWHLQWMCTVEEVTILQFGRRVGFI